MPTFLLFFCLHLAVCCWNVAAGVHMDRPPQSPNLNHIENLWDVLKKTLRGNLTVPSSIQDLIKTVMELWTEINLVTFQELIETMPWRMRVVIQFRGGPTKC